MPARNPHTELYCDTHHPALTLLHHLFTPGAIHYKEQTLKGGEGGRGTDPVYAHHSGPHSAQHNVGAQEGLKRWLDAGKEGRKERREGGVLALLLLLSQSLSLSSLPAPLALNLLHPSILVPHLQSKCMAPRLNPKSVSITEFTKEESGLTPEQMHFRLRSRFLTMDEAHSPFTLPGDEEGKRKMNNLFSYLNMSQG